MTVEPEVRRPATGHDSRTVHASSESVYSSARHVAHLVFIVVAVVALFWRVFFLGETLIDVATLNNQLPWGYSAGPSNYPYNRRDLTDTYVTRDYFVASAYRDGELPLWNPYTMAGHPIYADGVTRTLSPFLLFYRFFDVPLGYSLARITELMLAAIFVYLFLIAIGASGNGALMGSVVFTFSAHSMFHLTGLGWWGGFLWLPLIVLFVDRAIRRGSYFQALVAGACLAGQFFCGYLPNQIYYVGAVVLYYLFFAVVKPRRRVGSLLAMMAVTLAAGLVLSATQWVPSLELLAYSNRKIVGAELGYIYLPPWYGATLIFPNLFGTAYDAKMLTLFTALGVSHDHILYLGIAALLPLGFSLVWLRSPESAGVSPATKRNGAATSEEVSIRDRAVFFAVLAAISLLVMMAAPLYVPFTRFIPVLQFIRVAVRAGVLLLFAAAVLVAFGTDLLFASSRDLLRRYARLVRRAVDWIGGFVLLAVIGSYAIKLSGLAVDAGERGRVAFVRRTALALSAEFTPPGSSILFPLSLAMLLAFLLWLHSKRRMTDKIFLVCLIVFLVIDLCWNSRQFNYSFDRSRVFPRTEITDLLHSLAPGRVLVVPSGLETNRRVSSEEQKIIAPPNTLLPYQIPTVSGKNQQFPRWYREFAALVEPQPNLSHVVFDEYRSPYLDLLNVRYVMTHEGGAPLVGYRLLATAEGISVYENNNTMPRAFFVREVVEAQSHADALNTLADSSFDPRSTAVVEVASVTQAEKQKPALASAQIPGGGVRLETASATITEEKRNHIVIQTENGTGGLLVLSDNYYPGWLAFVDGSPAEIFRANCTMRAINVPPGSHVVSFAFVPASFFTSAYVSLAAAVLTFIILTASALKRRRE